MHFIVDTDEKGACQLVEGDVFAYSWCRFWRTVEELTVYNHKYTIHPGIGEQFYTNDNVDIKVIPSKED